MGAMKKSLLSAILILAVLRLVSASPVQTAIVSAGEVALSIQSRSVKRLLILNFVTDYGLINDGSASVTIGSRTAQVMQPQLGAETRIPFNLAGPATLTVNAATRGNITISYEIQPNT